MNEYNPLSVVEIEHFGPIIDVIIRATGSPLSGLKARGLIDTGATDIIVGPDTAAKLNLKYVNDDKMHVVGGGTLEAKIYSAWIEVPDLGFKRIVPIHVVNWKQSSHAILLGREFLRHFIFYYDGPKGMFHFSKPLDSTHETLENLDG